MARDTLLEPVEQAVLSELRKEARRLMELLQVLSDRYAPSEVKLVVAELLHDGQLELTPDRILRAAALIR